MKNLVIVLLMGIAAYKGYELYQAAKVQPLYDHPYVAVYGRDSCGFTQATLKDLKKAGISYHYFSVDDRQVAEVLHQRMQGQGLDTSHYLLPVVDLNNSISVRPDNKKLTVEAKTLLQ